MLSNFIKKRLRRRCFSANIVKFLEHLFLKTPAETASENSTADVFQESCCTFKTKWLNFWNLHFGRVGFADTGLNLKPRILSSIFSRVFQILAWKYLFCVQQEVFVVFIFPYFVPSWHILAQSLVKTFPKWKYFFFFFYSQVADNCSKLFFKDEHSYK